MDIFIYIIVVLKPLHCEDPWVQDVKKVEL